MCTNIDLTHICRTSFPFCIPKYRYASQCAEQKSTLMSGFVRGEISVIPSRARSSSSAIHPRSTRGRGEATPQFIQNVRGDFLLFFCNDANTSMRQCVSAHSQTLMCEASLQGITSAPMGTRALTNVHVRGQFARNHQGTSVYPGTHKRSCAKRVC